MSRPLRLLKPPLLHAAYRLLTRRHKLIVVAGMGRSGSTWLFNAVRLLHLQRRQPVYGYWIGDFDIKRFVLSRPDNGIVLLKTHGFHPVIARHAALVFYSIRDLRDLLASRKRMWNHDFETLMQSLAVELEETAPAWEARAAYTMRYETMVEDPASVLEDLALILGLSPQLIGEVQAHLEALAYENPGAKTDSRHLENLLHATHVTDGRPGSWPATLSPAEGARVVLRFGDWLARHHYS